MTARRSFGGYFYQDLIFRLGRTEKDQALKKEEWLSSCVPPASDRGGSTSGRHLHCPPTPFSLNAQRKGGGVQDAEPRIRIMISGIGWEPLGISRYRFYGTSLTVRAGSLDF